MATGKKPDPRRRKTRHPHATYLAVKPGETHPGYLAGRMYGCYTHRTHSAQPCISDITGDALECPYCRSGLDAEWRGYVPIWDRDWALRYVLIGEEIFESVDVIPFHAKITASRAKNPISPLVVREEMKLTRDLPRKEPWSAEVCMMDICLTLWKTPALTSWVLNNRPLAFAAAEVPAPASLPAPGKPYVAPAELKGEEEFGSLASRIMGKVAALPAANGKHKAPPKG